LFLQKYIMLAYRAIFLLVLCSLCAWGGVVYTFEPPTYNGSAPVSGGIPLGGQNGWVTPSGFGDALVFTYSGTPIPVAPGSGNTQFVAVQQNDEDEIGVSFAGSSEWAITFDVLVYGFSGSNYSAGSLYLFTYGVGYQLRAFSAVGANGTWNAAYDVFNPDGTPLGYQDPGVGFDGLLMDQWYQEQIVLSTTSNQILSVSIDGATYDPTAWYLRGGASASFDVTGMGIYGIGTLGFDNISLDAVPEPASGLLWLAGAGVLCCLRGRRR
jgi:hypothetical protein